MEVHLLTPRGDQLVVQVVDGQVVVPSPQLDERAAALDPSEPGK